MIRMVLTLLLLVITADSALAQAEDLARLQGKWELKFTRDGVQNRVVKTIDGKTETVEVYSNGMLVQKHHVDFELKSYGPAKVFIWRNGRIVAGPRAGEMLPDGRFLYRLGERQWIGVHGMLEGDQTGILTEYFQRIGQAPAGATGRTQTGVESQQLAVTLSVPQR